MSGKRAKRDEVERRAAGLLDAMDDLEERRGKPVRHPNRKKIVDEDVPDLDSIP